MFESVGVCLRMSVGNGSCSGLGRGAGGVRVPSGDVAGCVHWWCWLVIRHVMLGGRFKQGSEKWEQPCVTDTIPQP